MHSSSNGNALFLILIAVALFAALSYAVTTSTRSGGNSASKEKAKTNASAIVQYGAAMRSAVMRMKISNLCTDSTLNFANSVYKNNSGVEIQNGQNMSPTDGRCDLFSSNGGSMTPVIPPKEALALDSVAAQTANEFLPGHGAIRIFQIKLLGTDGPSGTSTANDIVFVQKYLSKDVCMAINDILSIPNNGSVPPTATMTGSNGGYTNGGLTGTGIIDDPLINGNVAFCRMRLANDGYEFIQSLVDR